MANKLVYFYGKANIFYTEKGHSQAGRKPRKFIVHWNKKRSRVDAISTLKNRISCDKVAGRIRSS